MYDVITIGAATQDVFLRSRAIEVEPRTAEPQALEQVLPLGAKIAVDDILFTTGGGATNTAVTFSRLGRLRTASVCEIGRDDPGASAVLADLRRDGVRTEFIHRDPKLPTAYSVVIVSGSGERTILVYRGASQDLIAAHIPWGKMRARWFYVTSLGGDLVLMRKIFAHAERTGAKVAWNPGAGEIARGWRAIAPLAARCAVFNVNREEAAALTDTPADNLTGILEALCTPTPAHSPRGTERSQLLFSYSHELENGLRKLRRVVLMTDGPGGAYVHDGHTTRHIASRNLKAVNTTGAGDAFGSAFVLGFMRDHQPSTINHQLDCALRLAMANAEGVIMHMGAKAGILSRVPGRAALAKYRVTLLRAPMGTRCVPTG